MRALFFCTSRSFSEHLHLTYYFSPCLDVPLQALCSLLVDSIVYAYDYQKRDARAFDAFGEKLRGLCWRRAATRAWSSRRVNPFVHYADHQPFPWRGFSFSTPSGSVAGLLLYLQSHFNTAVTAFPVSLLPVWRYSEIPSFITIVDDSR